MKDKWCYSWNEENFRGSFDSEEEAIKAARKEGPNAPYVYIGTCTECTLGWPGISASDVIEAISENLYEQCGEAAQRFDVSSEDEAALDNVLNEVIEKWIEDRNIKAGCYCVLDAEKVWLKD